MNTTLPADSEARKEYAIGRGCLAYFPAAIAGVARHSFKAGAKHTGGELVHKRFLSGDHDDCIERHLMDLRDLCAWMKRFPYVGDHARTVEESILNEANALAWRALALSQELHEKYGGVPLAPAARFDDGLIHKETKAEEANTSSLSASLSQWMRAISDRAKATIEAHNKLDPARSVKHTERYALQGDGPPTEAVDGVSIG